MSHEQVIQKLKEAEELLWSVSSLLREVEQNNRDIEVSFLLNDALSTLEGEIRLLENNDHISQEQA